MRNQSARMVALGGMLAALSVTIMCLGGMIPLATFICPVLCIFSLHIVMRLCGKRIAWAWYSAVAIISLLLCPDKEAAAVFLVLGYYPIIKPLLDHLRFRFLWKGLLFNFSILILYGLLLQILGLDSLSEDYRDIGLIGLVVLLVLGNVTFYLLDCVLGRFCRQRGKGTL